MEEGAYGNACNAAAIHGNFEIVECLGKYYKNIGSIANLRRTAGEIQRNAEKIFTPFLKADRVLNQVKEYTIRGIASGVTF